ncbi:UNVERIFIED_CONTAM: hypothetical protein Sradi_2599300 [Sesamum radiatum]|uniref:CCHC-type domain-containing protein n=1 Tax=Sesamum radiatum TaxID=300843 RepID=A0AAW2S3N9_SESRA
MLGRFVVCERVQLSSVGREGYVRGGQTNFMAGLKPWAQTELRRQGVKDLPSAIAAPDRLDDFKVANDLKQRNDDSRKGRKSSVRSSRRRRNNKEVTETFEPRAVERLRAGCFLCGNLEHRARDCPKRGSRQTTNGRLNWLGYSSAAGNVVGVV